MAFDREINVTKDAIADFEIVFFVPGPNNTNDPQAGTLSVQIILSDGTIQTRNFNLLARLQDDPAGQQHLANLASLKNYIKNRLESELLPT